MILLNILPSLTARKGIEARNIFAKAFAEYFQNKGHEKASLLIRNRYNISVEHNMSARDIAHYEIGNSFALLVNTNAPLFWVLFFIYSDPNLLQACRAELSKIATAEVDAGGQLRQCLDITHAKTHCPILTSAFTETLRRRTQVISVRRVMQDTLLNDTYLLRKGSTLLMPSMVVHNDPAIWGPDVETFKADRFLKRNGPNNKGTPAEDPAAFRGFGGGTTLCPGRHFATTEILAVVAMMVLRYEIVPIDGGTWTEPTANKINVGNSVVEPDDDVEVEVRPRKEAEHGSWTFRLADSEEVVFAVAAEDRGDVE